MPNLGNIRKERALPATHLYFEVEYFSESFSSDSESQFRRIFVNYSENRSKFYRMSLI